MLKKILVLLSKPFAENLTFFCVIFFLMVSIDLFDYINRGLIVYATYLFSHGFVDSYIITLSTQFFSGKFKRIYKFIVFTIIFLFFVLNVYCLTILETVFNRDIAAIILATNWSELTEFLSTCFTIQTITLIIITLIVSIIGYQFFSRRVSFMNNTRLYFIMTILCGCFLLSFHYTFPWKEMIFGEISNFWNIPKTPDLKAFYTHPKLEKVSDQPQNIVFIIGESFSKSHSSLYGYDKVTNPMLSKLQEDSLLFVFQNVESSALRTMDSFKAMMSTYRPSLNDTSQWYRCTTLQEIIHYSNYHSIWISNQSKKGFFDNLIGKYADLCDYNEFVGNKYAGLSRTSLDEEIIPIIEKVPQDTLNFYFIHLMGSHPDFTKRYPSSFQKFNVDDYPQLLSSQRSKIAAYDNSLLYNDFVVDKIMQMFSDREAIIFYFSDHALDLYESSDDYIGHAKFNNEKSEEVGKKIPFMIFCSTKYQKKFPENTQLVKTKLNVKFNTEDIIYTAMDIMGMSFNNNDDVNKYSILNKRQ